MGEKKEKKKKVEKFFLLFFYLMPFLCVAGYYLGYIVLFRVMAIPIALMIFLQLFMRFKTKDLRTLGVLSTLLVIISVQIGYFITDNLLDSFCMASYLIMLYGIIENIYKIIKDKITLGFLLFVYSLFMSLPINSQIVTTFSGEDAIMTEDAEVYNKEADLHSNFIKYNE